MAEKTLIVITGPTGSGKTDTAIDLALKLNAEIISADSRQIYRGIPIGTAAPTKEQLDTVKHHFVGIFDLDQYYSAAQFEEDAINLLPSLFEKSDFAVMCGGSMMYIDAVCKGIDNIPTISDEIRQATYDEWHEKGDDEMREILKALDPEHYSIVDLKNMKRVIHAIEICRQAGTNYTSLRTNTIKKRPFRIVKTGINLPREDLFNRINLRVEKMVENGLVEEAKSVYHLRHLNSLNTVGYKEMFAWLDGTMDFDTAVARIQKNTRVYAKKQLTWFAKDKTMIWLGPGETEKILELI